MLSTHRDKHAARRFLRGLLEIADQKPLRITTDAHPAYRKAIRWIVGRKVRHRCNRYLHNWIEQDHRAIKQRYDPMRGFGSLASAAQFCTAFDELRQYFRVRPRSGPSIPLATRRRLFTARWRSLLLEMQATEASDRPYPDHLAPSVLLSSDLTGPHVGSQVGR